MERSTIKLLEKRGSTNTEIARALGRDLKTVKRALIEPADKKYHQPKRGSLVDSYEAKIHQWLAESLPVVVMLQKAREDETPPYQGGNTIFYQRVQLIRQQLEIEDQKAIWRFEGLPGEYLQVDWGEKRNFPFTQVPPETRYCFVCRLKYSRFLYAEFRDNMRYETFIRCLLRCFESLGGVPWVLVFDNMSTVTTARNEDGNPLMFVRWPLFVALTP